MQDSGSHDQAPPGDATGTWAPAPAEAPSGQGSSLARPDPPTVRSGGPEGSSQRRVPGPDLLPRPGDRLESFELERAIGVGGMGAVFLATDTRLHREVALKILPPEQSGDSEVVQRFYQEARAAARLDHENIARVFTIGADKGFHYIAFEYIEGATLRQRVHEHGPLRIDEAINYTLQIAGALVHASERGVVHRDIKPSNIIVTPQGRAKLVDMGLARRFERGGPDDGLTQSGMTLGTFDYISPEQARDPRDVDVRGDLYSLGCTLFHMLTGRPPFPEGTVLQKLLQHQEEPPPDVRALNPSVPPDLGAILTKLMAKDRDRRYQTPELLVRDLLTVAGALGLRSLSPEGLVWMAPRTPPAWEKHLVWGVPATALAAVVAMLVWWGQPAEAPQAALDPGLAAGPLAPTTPPREVPSAAPPARDREGVTPAEVVAAPPSSAPAIPPGPPRQVVVKTAEELALALANEPSGSTLLLADDGPFDLRPAAAPGTGRRDLTIRAADNARPVLRPARASGRVTDASDPALLAFGPGEVRVEGVEFRGESGGADGPWSAILGDGTSLTLVRCTFRAPAEVGLGATPSALRLRAGSGASPGEPGPGARVVADACHFDGGQVAVRARGRADLRMRDCTFGPGDPSFWFDNAGAAAPVPVELALVHASVRAGRAPVVRAVMTALSVSLDRAIVAAPAGDRDATLVEIDDPDRLAWRGKGNLYAGLRAYLRPAGTTNRPPIRDFAAWADDPSAFREVGSIASEAPVWKPPDAGRPGPSADVSANFTPLPGPRPEGDPGARRGPRGPIPPAGPEAPRVAAADATPPRAEAPDPPPRPMPTGTPKEKDPVAVAAAAAGADLAGSAVTAPPDDGMAPMAPMERPIDEMPPIEPPPAAIAAEPPVDRGPKPDAAPLRTADALAAEIARLGDRGGVIRLAADADLRLGSLDFRGPGRIVLEGDATGLTRPRLRFRPGPAGSRPPGDRPAFFRLRAGSLELQGLDVILEDAQAPDDGAWEAFALAPGTDLGLVGCTVTVEGRRPRSAVVRVASGDAALEDELPIPDPSPARVRATDSLLRSGGDLVDVAAGLPLDLELSQAVVGTVGSLAHGHGLPRGSTPEALKLVIRQVTGRMAGGLLHLESAPGEPELPVADVFARDAILTTGDRSAPLIRLDGQDDLASLRDRLKWDGSGVVYHRIDVYRRDQTAQTGTLPQPFDRPSWNVAVSPRERMPVHGDAAFRDEWPPAKTPAAIDRDDVRLDTDAPAPAAGPDWRRIPPAPAPASPPRPAPAR